MLSAPPRVWTTPFQVGIECIEAFERRHRHQEVAARVPHQALHLAFVIALAGTAEPVLEQVVRLQLGEGAGALTPAVARDLRHRQPGVVVEDALGHSAQNVNGGGKVGRAGGGLLSIGDLIVYRLPSFIGL